MATASVLVADSVSVQPESRGMLAQGIFDNMNAPGFPVRGRFHVIAKVWGIPASQASAVIRVVRSETGDVVSEAPPHHFTPTGIMHVHTAISQFEGVVFPAPGIYEVQLHVGGQVAGYFPLRLVSTAPQAAQEDQGGDDVRH